MAAKSSYAAKQEPNLVSLERQAWHQLYCVLHSVVEVVGHNSAPHIPSSGQVLLHPPHVSQDLTAHLAVGLARLWFNDDEAPVLSTARMSTRIYLTNGHCGKLSNFEQTLHRRGCFNSEAFSYVISKQKQGKDANPLVSRFPADVAVWNIVQRGWEAENRHPSHAPVQARPMS